MRPRISAKQSVLVLGDIIGRVKAWPEPGDDCLAPRLEMHCGGVAANCAFAFAGWGVRPRLLGCVGRDNFGAYLLRRLRAAGVDVRWVQRSAKAMTGLLYVNVTPDGQRTFFGSRAANGLVRRVAQGSAFYRGAAGAHVVGYNFLDPATEKAARQLMRTIRARGGWIALDVGALPSQQIPRKILAGQGADVESDPPSAGANGTHELPRRLFGRRVEKVVSNHMRTGRPSIKRGALRHAADQTIGRAAAEKSSLAVRCDIHIEQTRHRLGAALHPADV